MNNQTTTLKYKIAKIISNQCQGVIDDSYEGLLQVIYDNAYRCIYKVPTNTFILGLIKTWVIKDVEHANKILKAVKDVVVESLEMSGIELTYTDDDWDNLEVIEELRWNGKIQLKLSKNDKPYLINYFEI